MAVTGPFSKSSSSATVRTSSMWYRQTKPYKVRLPYTKTMTWGAPTGANPHSWSTDPKQSNAFADAHDRAYKKFVEKIHGEQLMSLVNIAERRQTVDMVTSRAVQLFQFTRAVRRGELGRAAHVLGLSRGQRPHSARLAGKKFGDLWLEFHFGWKPLVKDIGRGIELLQSEFPPLVVKARAQATDVVSGRSAGPYWDSWHYTYLNKVQIAADVRVTNPNLYKANQMGLINPLATAWELVPFSFVVDWFVPIGDFLNSFSDFAGVSLDNPATTFMGVVDRHLDWYYSNPSDASYFLMERRQTIPNVKLSASVPTRLSPERAATAISLLLQQLGRR